MEICRRIESHCLGIKWGSAEVSWSWWLSQDCRDKTIDLPVTIRLTSFGQTKTSKLRERCQKQEPHQTLNALSDPLSSLALSSRKPMSEAISSDASRMLLT